jgi:hypothetical protein
MSNRKHPAAPLKVKVRKRRFLAEDRTRTGKAWMVYDLVDDKAIYFAGTDQGYAANCADKLERELNPDPNPD